MEFISELQLRAKWRKNVPNFLKPEALVLVNEDTMSRLKRKMGIEKESIQVLMALPG